MEEQLFPAFRSLDNPDDIDEERRLFYVAITRAESHLFLTYANSRYQHGNLRHNEPSRFLEEISEAHLEDSASHLKRSRVGSVQFGGSKDIVPRARVSGAFAKQRAGLTRGYKVDPKTFKPSSTEKIVPGAQVLHMKFGKGKVLR